MTTNRDTAMEDHVSTALRFLEHSDREFAAGDSLQGSEKIWGAVSHAVMAVAMQRGWDFGKYSARKAAVNRLAAEYGEPNLREEFFAAQQFHANFYHDFMEDDDFDWGRPVVHRFVHRLVSLVEPTNQA